MAQNTSRSQNQDLRKGIMDGVFKSLTPSRGGEVEEEFVAKRSMVLQSQYGITPPSPMAEVSEPVISL
jgi:hypothetical protein